MKKNNNEEIEVSIGDNDSEMIERLKEIIEQTTKYNGVHSFDLCQICVKKNYE